MRYAVFEKETGLIVNVIIWDGEAVWSPGKNLDVILIGDLEVDIGWVFENGNFKKPIE